MDWRDRWNWRAIPKSWSPMLYSPMMANVEFSEAAPLSTRCLLMPKLSVGHMESALRSASRTGSQESAMMMDRLKLMLGGWGV
ncbi:MAG: hypothetical protein IPM06_21785 [Rhizobiales bacterium]|nr:hypothetical protein [Hyphomicrobiales bacterium]